MKKETTSTSVTPLAPGLHAIQSTLQLNGRVASYPPSARGVTTSNCYLVQEDGEGFLIDTGFASQEAGIVGALKGLVQDGSRLQLFPLRLNEFMSVGNALAITRDVGAAFCYSLVPKGAQWMDVQTMTGEDMRQSALRLPSRPVPESGLVTLGASSQRVLEFVRPPMQLIPNRWMYDAASRTLFSSDMFGHVWRESGEGPFVISDTGTDTTTLPHVVSYLLNTRYWWLAGADTRLLVQALEQFFDSHAVDTIAPGYGCILQGRAMVERHVRFLYDALDQLDSRRHESGYIDHATER